MMHIPLSFIKMVRFITVIVFITFCCCVLFVVGTADAWSLSA